MKKKLYYKLERSEKDYRKSIKLLWKFFSRYIAHLLVVLVNLMIAVGSGLVIPYFVKIAIDQNIHDKDAKGLLQTSLHILIVSVVCLIATYLQVRITGALTQKVLFDVRRAIFKKLQVLPVQFFNENKTGDIIQRITNDVERINRFFSEGIVRFLVFLFSFMATGVIIFSLNHTLSYIAYTATILIFIFLFFQGREVRKLARESRDSEGLMSAKILETLDGIKTVKAYGQEKYFEDRFVAQNVDVRDKTIRYSVIANWASPILEIIANSAAVIILVVGLNQIDSGEITLGSLLSYLIYIVGFFQPIKNLSSLWSNIQTGLTSVQRIQEVLVLKTKIKEGPNPYNPNPEKIKGKVEFKNVSFKYDDSDEVVLKKVNLTVNPGETIAIVGQTGAGKTSFVNLLTRLYDATAGEVLVDNVNVKKWKINKLRGQVGYLLQDVFLFSDTIYNNLTFPDLKTSRPEVKSVLKKLGGDKFVKKLPKGIDTKLKKNGENLSMGQRQILALSRILLRDTKILILDEATASIDTKSEKVIQKALNEVAKNRTTFIIAHRLSTIENADKVMFIYDNKVLEYGTHKQLMAKKGKFFDMYMKYKKPRTELKKS